MSAAKVLTEIYKNTALVKVITMSVKQTVADIAKTQVIRTGDPTYGGSPDVGPCALAGKVIIEGQGVSFTLLLGLSQELFEILYQNMFNESIQLINQENHDLAGEILNIAFGSMDPEFRKMGLKLKASFPKVYSGKELERLSQELKSPSLCIRYASEGHFFSLNIL